MTNTTVRDKFLLWTIIQTDYCTCTRVLPLFLNDTSNKCWMLHVVPAANTRQAYMYHKALWIPWEAGAFTNGALNSADTDDVTAVWLNTHDNSLDIKNTVCCFVCSRCDFSGYYSKPMPIKHRHTPIRSLQHRNTTT